MYDGTFVFFLLFRVLGLALSLVQRQHQLIQEVELDSTHLQDDLACLSGLAQGDKGVAWADQTRVSTNDLHDVSTSSLSSTQQELFDCFLEHCSPRLSRKMFPPKAGPHNSPHLGILTCTPATPLASVASASSGCVMRGGQQAPNDGAESDEGSTTPTPTTPVSSGNTVMLRTSHTFSALTPSNGTVSHSPVSSKQSNKSNSVRVTTDVCFSSATSQRSPSPNSPRSPSPSCYSERDDISEVSSSGLGSTNSDPMNSDPLQEQDELDYDKLASMSHDRLQDLTGIIQTPTHYKWRRPHLLATPLHRGLYHNRPSTTSYQSTAQATPIAREAGPTSVPSQRTNIPLPPRRNLTTPPAPQPYSMFQPLQPPPRPSKGTPAMSNTNRMTTPTSKATPTSTLSSYKSISTDSGLGSITGTIVPQGTPGGGVLRRTPLLPPHRPNANGVMVRSSPSNTLPHSSHVSGFSYATRITGFEDNFVSPPSYSRPPPALPQPLHSQQRQPPNRAGKDSNTMKVPIGALLSPATRPFGSRAAPNPYVQDPAHQPRPVAGVSHQPRPITATLSTGNLPSATSYLYQDGHHAKASAFAHPRRGHTQSASSLGHGKPHMALGKQTSLSSSKGSLSDRDCASDHGLNSTFTVAVDVGCTRGTHIGMGKGSSSCGGSTASSSGGSDMGKKTGQGRGMFGRNKASGKLPSYQKMTKSAESKKTSRYEQCIHKMVNIISPHLQQSSYVTVAWHAAKLLPYLCVLLLIGTYSKVYLQLQGVSCD